METPVLERPDIFTEDDQEIKIDLPWNVILYNDDHHTFQSVVLQVQKATDLSLENAFEITMQVHTKGHAICHTGAYTDCEKVAAILREIGLTVKVAQEKE
jgi:ATP-dependent Clp protease adaptor protein ClpS